MGHYFRRRHEYIIFATKGYRKLSRRDIPDVWPFRRLHRADYPTQKPVEVFAAMLSGSAEPGFVVCDPFLGSGSAAIAALKQGCSFVGADVSERAIEIARQRVETFRETGCDPLQIEKVKLDGMASQQSRTRTWSVATSPRNPQKLPDEVGLLAASFNNRVWNREAQRDFAQQLAEAEFFEGTGSATLSDFSARDRVNRAPKTLGFIRLHDDRRIEILPAGRRLIEKRNLPDLFLHQLLKWQYPSPFHKTRDYTEQFKIRPFLECLRLIRELEGITKEELAIFVVPFIAYHYYEEVRAAIRDFRRQLLDISGRGPRRDFLKQSFLRHLKEVYHDDIEAGNFSTRQKGGQESTIERFLSTKRRNALDYADATMRYFLATGLFTNTPSPPGYRLTLLDERLPEADRILISVARSPEPYDDIEAYFDYLGDPETPHFPGENPAALRKRIGDLYNSTSQTIKKQVRPILDAGLSARSLTDLKSAYEQLSTSLTEARIHEYQQNLQRNMDVLENIELVFDQIVRSEVPDRPLYLEWNIWRALSFLNYGQIRPNFRMNQECQPISLSSGKADCECHYDRFHVIVDVTTSYGATQYHMESESVPRHVGSFQKERQASDDDRVTYGLFIALRLHPDVIVHFWHLHKIFTSLYGGPVSIIPLDLDDLRVMLRKARQIGHWSADDIQHFFKRARASALSASDEKEWHRQLRKLARNWLA